MDWSSSVVGRLSITSRPDSESNPMKSVNVPPTSMPVIVAISDPPSSVSCQLRFAEFALAPLAAVGPRELFHSLVPARDLQLGEPLLAETSKVVHIYR